MANRTIEAILRLSARLGNIAAFRTLGDNLDRVEGKARRFNRAQGAMERTANGVHGAMLRYAAPGVMAAGVGAAFTEFASIERQMERIGITAGATAEETDSAWRTIQQRAQDAAMPVDQAIAALDTLVASGLSMREAMDFLPSVLTTAQAAGADAVDIANTALKSASALGITAGEMQSAFDVMVAGGKAGQFELKDMAAYIPELANSFASLGYEGQEGLRVLIALLQTIREDTGTASSAATQAQNIFGKMFTEETSNKFSDFGIDLRAELEAAMAAGEGAVDAFVRLSREAIDGDLSKLPLLFTDQEFRLGMQSLITSADSYNQFLDAVNNSDVDGSTLRDFFRIIDDNQAKIDRMSNGWREFKASIGGGVAPAVGGTLEGMTEDVERMKAVRRGLDMEGTKGFWAQERALLSNAVGNIAHPEIAQARENNLAWRGGYRTDEDRQLIAAHNEFRSARENGRAIAPADASAIAAIAPRRSSPAQPRPDDRRPDHAITWAEKEPPSTADLRERMFGRRFDAVEPVATAAPKRKPVIGGSKPVIDLSGFGQEVETALTDGGSQAGRSISESAQEIERAGTAGGQQFGTEAGSVFSRMLDGLAEAFGMKAASAFNQNVRAVAPSPGGGAPAASPVSGVRGRSMPSAGSTPSGPR